MSRLVRTTHAQTPSAKKASESPIVLRYSGTVRVRRQIVTIVPPPPYVPEQCFEVSPGSYWLLWDPGMSYATSMTAGDNWYNGWAEASWSHGGSSGLSDGYNTSYVTVWQHYVTPDENYTWPTPTVVEFPAETGATSADHLELLVGIRWTPSEDYFYPPSQSYRAVFDYIKLWVVRKSTFLGTNEYRANSPEFGEYFGVVTITANETYNWATLRKTVVADTSGETTDVTCMGLGQPFLNALAAGDVAVQIEMPMGLGYSGNNNGQAGVDISYLNLRTCPAEMTGGWSAGARLLVTAPPPRFQFGGFYESYEAYQYADYRLPYELWWWNADVSYGTRWIPEYNATEYDAPDYGSGDYQETPAFEFLDGLVLSGPTYTTTIEYSAAPVTTGLFWTWIGPVNESLWAFCKWTVWGYATVVPSHEPLTPEWGIWWWRCGAGDEVYVGSGDTSTDWERIPGYQYQDVRIGCWYKWTGADGQTHGYVSVDSGSTFITIDWDGWLQGNGESVPYSLEFDYMQAVWDQINGGVPLTLETATADWFGTWGDHEPTYPGLDTPVETPPVPQTFTADTLYQFNWSGSDFYLDWEWEWEYSLPVMHANGRGYVTITFGDSAPSGTTLALWSQFTDWDYQNVTFTGPFSPHTSYQSAEFTTTGMESTWGYSDVWIKDYDIVKVTFTITNWGTQDPWNMP
jgi:hypothetical protein